MRQFWSEEKIERVKADEKERDKVRAEIEAKLEESNLQLVPRRGYRVATEDAIRHFCDGIGNVNPLYRSRDYARNSIYGGLIAPPNFLHAIAPQGGIPRGTQLDYITSILYAGTQTEWFKIIREGDEFTVFFGPSEVRDITRESTALQFLSRRKTVYKNQRDEIVAILTSSVISLIAAMEEDKLSAKPMERVRKSPKLHHFSEQEVEEWYQLMEQEEIRGANPRFWEDVNLGDQLPPTHHFFTMMQTAAFLGSSVGFTEWRFVMAQKKAGALGIEPDPETGIPDFLTPSFHLTDAAAQRQGVDRAFCTGMQMECWLGNLITNWMGDTGFLKKMEVQFRKLLFRGSKVICKGQVIRKYIEGDEHLVDLHITLEDGDGIFPVPNGSATVVLSSRH